jgi:hypothetical protein
MENYFYRLISRSSAMNEEYMQPVPSNMFESAANDIESQPYAGSPEVSPVQAEQDPAANAPSPMPAIAVTQHLAQNTTEHFHYLQQYISRAAAGSDGLSGSAPPAGKNVEEKFRNEPMNEPTATVSPFDAIPQENKQALQARSAEQVKKTVPVAHPENPVQATIPGMAQPFSAVTWLLPATPAAVHSASPVSAALKPAPSLTIGKILIEILPAKPVQPRTGQRPSPFQNTGTTGRSSGSGFGLGQL